MDRADRIQFGHYLLDRAEADRHTPEIGGLLAARWASAAFAHALMAYSGDSMITEVPTSMYAAAARLDREAGGGEWWRQAAYAAYEISHAFYSGRIACRRAGAQDRGGRPGSQGVAGPLGGGGAVTGHPGGGAAGLGQGRLQGHSRLLRPRSRCS